MRAKDFLGQIEKLDTIINNKLIEKEQWKDIATSATAQYDGIPGRSSGSQQRMADAVGKMVDIEREIDLMIEGLVNIKKDVISVIEQLNATEYDVLHKIYIQRKTLDEVAAEKRKTYSWVTTVHGRALQSVQRVLDARK